MFRNVIFRGCVAAVAIALSAANSHAQGSIEGDLFVLTKGGDVKRGAGLTVSLVPVDAKWGAGLKPVCTEARDRARYLTGAYKDSVNRDIAAAEARKDNIALISLRGRSNHEMIANGDSLTARIDRLVATLASTARVNIQGHYRFPSVANGSYLVFAEWEYNDEKLHWRVPVTITSAAVTVDLDQSNRLQGETDGPFLVCAEVPL